MFGRRGYDVYGVAKKINRHVIRALRRLNSLAERDDTHGILLSEVINEVLYTTRNLVPVRNSGLSVYRSLVNFAINGVVTEVDVHRFLLVDDDGAALLCGIPTLAEKARRDQEKREKAMLEASGAGSKRHRKRRLYFTSPYKLRKQRERRAAAKMRSDEIVQNAVASHADQATAAESVAEGVTANIDTNNIEQVAHWEPVPPAGPKRRPKKHANFTSPYKLRKQRERRAAAEMRSDGIVQNAVASHADQATAAESVAEGVTANIDTNNIEQVAHWEPVPPAGPKRRRKKHANFTSPHKLRKQRERRAAAKMRSDGVVQNAVSSHADQATAAESVAEGVTANIDTNNIEQVAHWEPVPPAGPKRRPKKHANFTSPYKLRKQRERRAAAKMRSDGIVQNAVSSHADQATAAESVAEGVTANIDTNNIEQVAHWEPVPPAGPKRRPKKHANFTSPYKLRKQRERRAAAKMRSDGIVQNAVSSHADQATAAESVAEGVTANIDTNNIEQVAHWEPVPPAGPKRRPKKHANFTSPYKLRKQRERRAAAKMRSEGITQEAVTTRDTAN